MIVSGSAIVSVVLSLPTVGPLLLQSLQSLDQYLAGSILFFLPTSSPLRCPLVWLQPPAGRPSYQEALTMAAEKARHLALNMPGIDDYSLLEEELRDLARAYPVQALPELINPLVTLQDAVHQAILSPRRPGDAAQLFSIGAVTGGILAKASHDLGDPRAAVTQARTALILAEQAGNATIAAWLNGLMALIGLYVGVIPVAIGMLWLPWMRRIVGSSAETSPPAGCRTSAPWTPRTCS
jgi:hypothetical protein